MRIHFLVLLGICAGVDLAFSFIAYPALSSQFLAFDGDGFARLATSLLHCGTLGYDCGDAPTVFRGPAYPAALALANLPWGEIDAMRVALFQTLLNLLTLAALMRMAGVLAGKRTAVTAGVLFLLHPLAHVFVPRPLADTLLATLFFGGLTMLLVPPRGDHRIGDTLAGGAFTAALLVKQVMLPMVPLAAILVMRLRGGAAARRSSLLAGLLPLLLILPWTIRTSQLAGTFVPLHTGSGFNVVVGNDVVRSFFDDPFAGLALFERGQARAQEIAGAERHDDPVYDAVWDGMLLRAGIGEMTSDPALLVGKLSLNVLLFFTLGTSVSNSLVMLAAFLALLPFVVRGLRGFRGLPMGGTLVVVALVYMGLHLPVYAIGRFSIPILPILLLFAAIGMQPRRADASPS